MKNTIELLDFFLSGIDSTKTIAIAGLALSLLNIVFTWQGRRLAKEQEKRREPLLRPFIINGYFKHIDSRNKRIYAFLISVSNPTDNGNSIVSFDLLISYAIKNKAQMTLKVKSQRAKEANFIGDQDQEFLLPASISAHGTVAGWLFFIVPWSILSNNEIQSHKLSFTDSHGKTFEVIPILVQEYIHETQI